MKPTDLPPKLAARIRIDAETDCWLWVGYVQPEGYGQVAWPPSSRRRQRSHRVVWTLLKGPIPDGLTIDHLCRVKLCCNPDHLEVVTKQENTIRGKWREGIDGRCRTGKHPWVPANIYVRPSGHRECRLCKQINHQRCIAAGKNRKRRPGTGQMPMF